MARDVGRTITRKRTGREAKAVSVYFPLGLYRRLMRHAERENHQVSPLIVRLVKAYLDEHDG